MAEAKKCDRCGNYYDDNTYGSVKQDDKGNLVGTGYTIIGIDILKNIGGRNIHDEHFDLCDSCIVKFYLFMNELDIHECEVKKND